MQRHLFVRFAALIWGLVVFMPVGVNYVGLLLVLLALLAAGNFRPRFERLCNHPLWWPLVIFTGWTLVVWAIEPHYPQTPSNLVHGLRIVLTIALALMIDVDETLWALRGFALMALVSLAMIALFYSVGFPLWETWRGVLIPVGNKSISNALLLTIFGACATVVAIEWFADKRWAPALAALALTVAVALVVTATLPSRTSQLALILALAAACLHRWRRRLRPLAAAMVIGVAVVGVLVWESPSVQQKFALGVQEIEAAQAGSVSEGSWVVRYYMYRETAAMMLDKPFAGWGIGGWTSQWHERGPALLADYNMPHNDYLWMGAQAGVPGFLSLLLIMLVGLRQAWRRVEVAGRLAFVAMLILALATSVNSALRDAQIGLSLLWVTMLFVRLASEPSDAHWRLLPTRAPATGAASKVSVGGPTSRRASIDTTCRNTGT